MNERRQPMIVHGAAVAFAGRGILILGASGAGKSPLALGLIGAGRGARGRRPGGACPPRRHALVARAPAGDRRADRGAGLGILRLPAVPEAPLALAVDLDQPAATRMPQL